MKTPNSQLQEFNSFKNIQLFMPVLILVVFQHPHTAEIKTLVTDGCGLHMPIFPQKHLYADLVSIFINYLRDSCKDSSTACLHLLLNNKFYF